MKTTQLYNLWLDRMILDLPVIDGNRTTMNEQDEAITQQLPARISIGIVDFNGIYQPLLRLLSHPAQPPKPDFPAEQRTFLASFDIDSEGRPLPKTAELHISLVAIKLLEMEGKPETLLSSYRKYLKDFRRKLRRSTVVTTEKLKGLITWLQGFLPVGCEMQYGYYNTIHQHMRTNVHTALLKQLRSAVPKSRAFELFKNFILGQDPTSSVKHKYQSLRYDHKLSETIPYDSAIYASTYRNPAIWPFAKSTLPTGQLTMQLNDIKMRLFGNYGGFNSLHAQTKEARTILTLELAAQYLIGEAMFAQKKTTAHQAAGFFIFSGDTRWLQELEESFDLIKQTYSHVHLSVSELTTQLTELAEFTYYLRELQKKKHRFDALEQLDHEITAAIHQLHKDRLSSASQTLYAPNIPPPILFELIPEDYPVMEGLFRGFFLFAIVDCTSTPSPIFLAQICMHFENVVLLNADRKALLQYGLPDKVNRVLFQKHHINLP